MQDCDLNVEKVRGFNSGCGIDSPTLVSLARNKNNTISTKSMGYLSVGHPVEQLLVIATTYCPKFHICSQNNTYRHSTPTKIKTAELKYSSAELA